MLRISDFDAFTFDVYGTLIDWEPGIIAFLADWAKTSRVTASDAELLTAFDDARAAIQKERPAHIYPEVLRRCFDRICGRFGVAGDQTVREAFSATPHQWPPYPDSHAGLKALQARGKVGALSNIDDRSLASSCRRLDFKFDVIVTAERVAAYKPDLPHFAVGISDLVALGIPYTRILHVGQSLRADVAPANRLGLTCAWINRPERSLGLTGDGASAAKPDLTVSSLEELVRTLTSTDNAGAR